MTLANMLGALRVGFSRIYGKFEDVKMNRIRYGKYIKCTNYGTVRCVVTCVDCVERNSQVENSMMFSR